MGIQDAIVFIIVAGAVAYLGRHFWLSARGKKGCGGCGGGCGKPVQGAPKPPQLVQIDLGNSFKK